MRADAAREAALAALRTVPVLLPELGELTPLIRVSADDRVATAGVFASGRVVVNPDWFFALSPGDAVFVMAHELLHLSLRTHDRAGEMAPRVVNVAHDYIINDMLVESLSRAIPADGLSYPGARHMSLEELAPRLDAAMLAAPRSFRAVIPVGSGALGAALRNAKLAPPLRAPAHELDVLPPEVEREMFPAEPIRDIDLATTRVRTAALRAVSVAQLRRGIDRAMRGRGVDPGGAEVEIEALEHAYRPPWEEALQTWIEAALPGERTYVRPSRRGADREDVVLPGRRREGRTLHLVLDTSGSMTSEFSRILGAIANFCEAVNVSVVRVLQCDVEVTRDELVEVDRLRRYALAGLGGSDLCPAMWRLALDPEVEAAVVITDGYIAYPEKPMPYSVLWAVTSPGFDPGYGKVVLVDR